MFDIGFWELLLCFVIALVVLGPERLPGAARTLGGWVRRARAFVRQLGDEWEQELDTQHWREEAKRLREELERTTRQTVDEMKTGSPDSESEDPGSSRTTSRTTSQTTSEHPGDDEREQ